MYFYITITSNFFIKINFDDIHLFKTLSHTKLGTENVIAKKDDVISISGTYRLAEFENVLSL